MEILKINNRLCFLQIKIYIKLKNFKMYNIIFQIFNQFKINHDNKFWKQLDID